MPNDYLHFSIIVSKIKYTNDRINLVHSVKISVYFFFRCTNSPSGSQVQGYILRRIVVPVTFKRFKYFNLFVGLG